MANRGLTLKFDLKNTRQLLKKYEEVATNDEIKEEIQHFADEVKTAILLQYISTYSTNPAMIRRRTYRLERALDYAAVLKKGKDALLMKVTKDKLWPLGTGEIYYAKIQEEGSITLPARQFIAAGYTFIQENLPDFLRDLYKKILGKY